MLILFYYLLYISKRILLQMFKSRNPIFKFLFFCLYLCLSLFLSLSSLSLSISLYLSLSISLSLSLFVLMSFYFNSLCLSYLMLPVIHLQENSSANVQITESHSRVSFPLVRVSHDLKKAGTQHASLEEATTTKKIVKSTSVLGNWTADLKICYKKIGPKI